MICPVSETRTRPGGKAPDETVHPVDPVAKNVVE
jgi:hypothetical protein